MKKLLLVGVLLCLAFTAPAQAPDRAVFQEAENRFRNQDYELALERYEALVRQYPLSEYVPDAQYRRAVSLFRLGRYEESLELLRRVENRYRSTQYLEFVPFWKGVSQYYLGRHQEAVAALDSFLRTTEDTRVEVQALLYMALSQIALDERDEAIESLEILLGNVSDLTEEPYALSLLLNMYVKEEQYGEAISRFEAVDTEALTSRWKPYIVLYAAEAHYARKEYGVSRTLYSQLKDAPTDVASVAYQRLFQIARATMNEQELLQLLREAEQALAGRTSVLKTLWRKVGIESYQSGRYDLAELYFQRVWDLRGAEPISATVPLYLSRIYEQRRALDEAVRVLEEYLNLTGGDKEQVLFSLANAYLDRENWQGAVRALAQFREQYPESDLLSEAAYRHAFALYKAERYEDALAVISEVFGQGRAGGLTADFLWLKSVLHRETDQLQSAVQALREYMPLRPEDQQGRVEYLKLLFVRQRYEELVDEASRMFPEPEQLREGNASAYVQLQYVVGLAHIARKNYEAGLSRLGSYEQSVEALRTLADGQNLSVIYPYTLYYRGWAYYRLSQYAEAIETFSTLLSEAPDHEFAARASYLAGWSAFSTGNYEQAETFLRRTRTLEISTDLAVQTSFLLGQTLSAAGRYDESTVEFRNVFEDHPSSAYADDAVFEFAGVLLEMGRLEEAVETYRRVYVSYPDSVLSEEAMYKRGEILYENRDFEAARNAFFEYRSNFPEGGLYDAALYWGGMAHFQLDQKSGALHLWERLIDQYRTSPFRSAAMQRAAEVYEDQGDYRKALNMLSDFIAAYPEEATAVGARREADELVLVIGGLSEAEAALWVTIDENNRAETDAGRDAILELARMTIYEGGTAGVTESLIRPLLRQTAERVDEDPEAAGRATFLLAEHSYRNGDIRTAADLYLDAAATYAQDRNFAAESLFRAAQMKELGNSSQEALAIVEELRNRFPDSEWTQRAQRAVEERQ